MNLKIKSKKPKSENQRGVTLFIAVTIMAVLLFISFVVINIAVKSTQFVGTARESQLAFSAADAGVECALYWDTATNAFNNGPTFLRSSISEFSGIVTTDDVLDRVSSAYPEATSGGQVISSGTKTTNYSNELIYGLGVSYGDMNPGPGFSTVESNFLRHFVESRNVTSVGDYAATITSVSGHFNYMIFMATFKALNTQTPALVQKEGKWVADAVYNLDNTISFSNPSGNGNLIVAAFTYDVDQPSIDKVIDSKGNKYRLAMYNVSPNWPDPWTTEVWYAENISGGGSPITITVEAPKMFSREISCNGENIYYESQIIPGTGSQPSVIGGTGWWPPEPSIFWLDFENDTCAIVEVIKNLDGSTNIRSKGYNTCDTSNPRRMERGVEINYSP